jgi:hypothetical protein
MSKTELLAVAGLGATLFAIYKTKQPTIVVTSQQARPNKGWSGAGVDPFGVSYTVTGRAARGGL